MDSSKLQLKSTVHIVPSGHSTKRHCMIAGVYNGPMSFDEYCTAEYPDYVKLLCYVEQRTEATVTRVISPFVQVKFTANVRPMVLDEAGNIVGSADTLETKEITGWIYEGDLAW